MVTTLVSTIAAAREASQHKEIQLKFPRNNLASRLLRRAAKGWCLKTPGAFQNSLPSTDGWDRLSAPLSPTSRPS